MTTEQKIALADNILRYLSENSENEQKDMPILVGGLKKPYGITGFKTAEQSHPVFEYKDRYIIYLQSLNGETTVAIPFYKESLTDKITIL